MSESEIPPDPDAIRLGAAGKVLVSDKDRARMADVIGDAFAEGRLNREEYEVRLTATMQARTADDLVPVLEGLPPATVASALAPLTGMALAVPGRADSPDATYGWHPPAGLGPSSTSVVAIFGGATRKGAWVMPAELTAFAMFGGVELDFTRATFAKSEVELTAIAVMGGIEITVPDGLTVQVDGMGIFGGFDQRAEGPGLPGAPVLRIKGTAVFGGVEVKRKPRRDSLGAKVRPQLPEA